jgi:hypothetical protein
MGLLSRVKGKIWERECVRLLKPIFGDLVCRGAIAQTRFGACEAPDCANVPGWWVEAKHGIKVNLRAALEQAHKAEEDFVATRPPGSEPRRWPVALCKDNRSRPVAIMYLDDWLTLVGQWWAQKTPLREPVVTSEPSHD